MRKVILLLAILAIADVSKAQSYTDSINAHRQHYKEEFITEERSPLKGDDTSYLRFYAADKRYRATATVQLTPEAQPFKMPTYSGKVRDYRQYATITFTLLGKPVQMALYQNLALIKDPKHKDHLFLPFTDNTNNKETYGGGRYIDLELTDIKDGKLVIDFNKCYNPYCAYSDGYNCPIPPRENSLDMKITAGEMLYGKEH